MALPPGESFLNRRAIVLVAQVEELIGRHSELRFCEPIKTHQRIKSGVFCAIAQSLKYALRYTKILRNPIVGESGLFRAKHFYNRVNKLHMQIKDLKPSDNNSTLFITKELRSICRSMT